MILVIILKKKFAMAIGRNCEITSASGALGIKATKLELRLGKM